MRRAAASLLRGLHVLVGWAVLVPATAAYATVAVVAVGLARSPLPGLRVARAWGRLCLRLAGCALRVDGRERIDPGARYVVMANHQSNMDIPALLAALPVQLQTSYWAKESLFRVPFLGAAMRAMGFVPVDRVNRSSAAAMFAASLQLVRDGRSPLVFPEETLAPDDDLLPFQRGGFLMAIKSGLPVLPVGVKGTRDVLPPGSRRFKPGPVRVRIGEPIPTADLKVTEREELAERVRAAVDGLRSP